MTFIERLLQTTAEKNSLLCVGLDPDRERLPSALKNEPQGLEHFCREVIQHTAESAAAFKLNLAFFEAEGANGWRALERLLAQMPAGVLTIADAKRADIGNSSQKYAESILQQLNFDAVTVSPYMGRDSVAPFLQWPEKGAFILGLTSNPGASDFQHLPVEGKPLYQRVVQEVVRWNDAGNCGLVVGATRAEDIGTVRGLAPELPFLIPGVGAQGGSLEDAIRLGTDAGGERALINASRSIIYKSGDSDFAEEAAAEADSLKRRIDELRQSKKNGS